MIVRLILVLSVLSSLACAATFSISCVPGGDPWASFLSATLPQCSVAQTPTAPIPTMQPYIGVMNYTKNLEVDGWDQLVLEMAATNDTALIPLATRHYAMGYLEGYVTFEAISGFFDALMNTSLGDLGHGGNVDASTDGTPVIFTTLGNMLSDAAVLSNITSNLRNVEAFANASSASGADKVPFDGYQESLQFLLLQIRGMADGFAKGCALQPTPVCSNATSLLSTDPRTALYLLNFRNEVADVSNALAAAGPQGKLLLSNYLNIKTASVLVAATASDIFVAHSSHDSYQIGLRKQYKTYNFLGSAAAKTAATASDIAPIFISMSSYPGAMSSQDDWFMTGSGLAVVSCPLANVDDSRTAQFLFGGSSNSTAKPSVPTFLRAMLANYYSADGPSWTDIFCFAPSGTYAAQWLIVDMKLYVEASEATLANGIGNSALVPNTLTILESAPGLISSTDGSSALFGGQGNNPVNSDLYNGNGFWAGYAVPAFPSVLQATQASALEATYGAFFSASENPLLRTIARNVTSNNGSPITGPAAIADILRWNNYASDPLSVIQNCSSPVKPFNNLCSPLASSAQALGARGDLAPNPRNVMTNLGPLSPLLAFRLYGAVDVKVCSFTGMMQSTSTLGPAFVSQVASGPSAFNSDSALPLFDWIGFSVAHTGLPSSFNFSSVSMASYPSIMPVVNGSEPAQEPGGSNLIIVGFACGVAVLLIIIGITVYSHRKKAKADIDRQVDLHKRMAGMLASDEDGVNRLSECEVADVQGEKQRLIERR